MAAAMMAVRSAVAVASGIVAGVLLCLAIELQPQSFFTLHLNPGGWLRLTAGGIAGITIVTASEFGVMIVVLSVPLWWLVGRFHRQTALVAALLGFLMTAATYFLTFGGGR